MQPIIEEVNYDAKVEADSNVLVVEVYDLLVSTFKGVC